MSNRKKQIVLLPGDGIGPEVVGAAVQVLEECARAFNHSFQLLELPIGGDAIDRCGEPLPRTTLDACRAADAILLGAVGGPQWDSLPLDQRPESALLLLRKELELFGNLRPIRLSEALRDVSPLHPSRAARIDLEIVRELAGGIYFGEHRLERRNGLERASDLETYTTEEIERVARLGFARARRRRRQVASVDKANVLATSALWRKTVDRLAGEHPDVTVKHLYVDNAALQLILHPQQFDVILTSNMFGDILSDAAAALVGSIGLIPSMSYGVGPPLFEPIHGAAPDIAGQDRACPIGAILCASLMLREAFGLAAEADWIESALEEVLQAGYRTADIAGPAHTVLLGSQFVQQVRSQMQDSRLELDSYGWGV